MEKDNLPLIAEWSNNLDFCGDHDFIPQMSRADFEKMQASRNPEGWFFVERKDGAKIGGVNHRPVGTAQELGYAILPSERGKGYGAEAATIMVDHLFLTKDLVRVQAHTNTENKASQRVLEKVGFKREGVLRKLTFLRGAWTDFCIYSILREEWKEPKILTRIT